eukprot:TRINITY_DN7661_c0_g1_i1.p1 TRINITY_DN7661_c0_g1~~TRINITY_DN7661_c0_g1_i1.p1  ORF type:complete len:303 (+),score=94.67 TRINITY_DN7661_c0_g1_i1:66-911(+)
MEEHPADKMKRRMEERDRAREQIKVDKTDRLSDDVDAFDKLFYGELRQKFDGVLEGGDIDGAVEVYREMQRVLQEAVGYLPQWDKQRANEVASECIKLLDAKKAKKKKKFAFTRPTRSVIIDVGTKQAVQAVDTNTSNDARISNKVNETIHIAPNSSIFLSRLTNCKIFIKPIEGSVFIDSCKGCTFVAACRQLRVHTTTASSFYLLCSSEPIIEDTTNVGFAPYLWDFEGKQTVLDGTSLGGYVNKWDQVNDFKWLKAQHSPNWHIIPEEERNTFTEEAS